jgi:hypothetical protein
MSSSTHTPSSSKSDFTALTLWLNREREAFPQLMKKGVESEFSTPKMPGHYSSSTPCERKRKSLGSEMGFYEVMITEGGQEEARPFGEIEFESFEASGVLALSPDVSIEQENSVRQIIVVEMEEEEGEDYDQAEQYEHGLSQIQEEECGHFLDPVKEVTEEPTIIEWEVEEEEQQQQQQKSLVHTSTPKRIQSSSITSNKLHDWARLHGLGTPSSFAPSPIATASRFGWAEVIAQTKLEELEERRSNCNNNSVVTTIFSPFSPAKAMGFKSDFWIMSPTKPKLTSKRSVCASQPNSRQLFEEESLSDDSLGWIQVQPVFTNSSSKSENNSTIKQQRKPKWSTIIPDRFASIRSRSSSR